MQVASAKKPSAKDLSTQKPSRRAKQNDQSHCGDELSQNNEMSYSSRRSNRRLDKEHSKQLSHFAPAAQQAPAAPPVKPIPDELRNLTKTEVTYLMNTLPSGLRSPHCHVQFLKLLSLYYDGILSLAEVCEMVQDLRTQDSVQNDEANTHLQ